VKLAKVIARKASALEKSGKLQESLAAYQAALLENNDPTIKDAMKLLEKKKKAVEAKEYLNSDIAEEHKVKGTELFKTGNFPGAIKEFDEGLRRDPTNVALYSNRALAFIKLLVPASAMNDALKCLELDPTFVKGWARKGTCHQMMKEYHKAIEAFDKGLNLDPSSRECNDGKMKTVGLINATSHSSAGNDEERMRHAMADPEVQQIMRDPVIMQIIRDLSENPAAGQAALKDPTVMAKIQKLIAAGVLKTG
jgi:stress-induced-phosphoprotein 1